MKVIWKKFIISQFIETFLHNLFSVWLTELFCDYSHFNIKKGNT